jgi:HEPN domain-containing protein
MSETERLREVERWLRYARDDLRVAELIAAQGGVPRAACFHAQQAAEKALKSIFVFLQNDFPYTHDLNRLRDSLPEGWPVKGRLPDLSNLSLWAAEPRYPGDLPDATTDEAETAIGQARGVLRMALEDLEGHGYAPKKDEEPQTDAAEREQA